jgi:hypothetical protein
VRSSHRSTRSHAVELVLAAVAILAIWLFVTGDGVSWAGELLGGVFAPR